MRVPQRDGKHADGRFQCRLDAPGLEAGQQRLGVGVAAPGGRSALAFQALAQLQVIVDLAIERHDGLMPGRREVDDGQTSMGETQADDRIDPQPLIVRAAMNDGVRHPFAFQKQRCFGRLSCQIEMSCKSTHKSNRVKVKYWR